MREIKFKQAEFLPNKLCILKNFPLNFGFHSLFSSQCLFLENVERMFHVLPLPCQFWAHQSSSGLHSHRFIPTLHSFFVFICNLPFAILRYVSLIHLLDKSFPLCTI